MSTIVNIELLESIFDPISYEKLKRAMFITLYNCLRIVDQWKSNQNILLFKSGSILLFNLIWSSSLCLNFSYKCIVLSVNIQNYIRPILSLYILGLEPQLCYHFVRTWKIDTKSIVSVSLLLPNSSWLYYWFAVPYSYRHGLKILTAKITSVFL